MYSYKSNAASQEQILAHFRECAFEPRLESYVNPEEYVEKILNYAQRFECWNGTSLAGLVAIYANDKDSGASFITMVSVGTQYGGKGIAGNLIEQAIDFTRAKGFRRVRLEVFSANQRAIRLYRRFGFEEVQSGEDKLIMELELQNND